MGAGLAPTASPNCSVTLGLVGGLLAEQCDDALRAGLGEHVVWISDRCWSLTIVDRRGQPPDTPPLSAAALRLLRLRGGVTRDLGKKGPFLSGNAVKPRQFLGPLAA